MASPGHRPSPHQLGQLFLSAVPLPEAAAPGAQAHTAPGPSKTLLHGVGMTFCFKAQFQFRVPQGGTGAHPLQKGPTAAGR